MVAFDEFQDFRFVEPSVYPTLQRLIDENEERKNLLLIFTGSTIGMIEKLFRDSKEPPLYGRIKREIHLKPLDIRGSYEMARELDIVKLDDFFKVHSVFGGGFPRYWVAIEDEGLEGRSAEEILRELFFEEYAPLAEEVPRCSPLSSERDLGGFTMISWSHSQRGGHLDKRNSRLSQQGRNFSD